MIGAQPLGNRISNSAIGTCHKRCFHEISLTDKIITEKTFQHINITTDVFLQEVAIPTGCSHLANLLHHFDTEINDPLISIVPIPEIERKSSEDVIKNLNIHFLFQYVLVQFFRHQ